MRVLHEERPGQNLQQGHPVAVDEPVAAWWGVVADVVVPVVEDEAFLAEAKQYGLDMNPMSGDLVTQIVNDTINAPADSVAKAKAAIEPAGGGSGKPNE